MNISSDQARYEIRILRATSIQSSRTVSRGNLRAFVASIVRQEFLARSAKKHSKFLLAVARRYRLCIGAPVTPAVVGNHFQVTTNKSTAFTVPGIGAVFHCRASGGLDYCGSSRAAVAGG